MLRAIALLIAAAICTSAFAQVQQQDPFAEQYRREQVARYYEARAAYRKHIRYLYFAAGCKVFTMEIHLIRLVLLEDRNIVSAANRAQLQDGKGIAEAKQAAIQEGRQQASEPNACNYWHEHPDEVYSLRRSAETAIID
jgi:hypothetical protein